MTPSSAAFSVHLKNTVRTLFPGYFALTMATGIIALGCASFGYESVGCAFFVITVGSFVVLWLLSLARAGWHRGALAQDFMNTSRSPAFFTAVVATNVVARGFLRFENAVGLAMGLWFFAWVLWGILLYGFGLSAVVKEEKAPFDQSVNGTWFILVVATQSMSVNASNLAANFPSPGAVLFVSALLFMLGCGFYLAIVLMVLHRMLFYRFAPSDCTPAYWVAMGALAISTLAGSELARTSKMWTVQMDALPVLQGFMLFLWVVASAWIPLLLLLGYWRHRIGHAPLVYDPQYWSMVFPLGMYAVATLGVSQQIHLPALKPLALTFEAAALLVWTLAGIGLVRNLHPFSELPANDPQVPKSDDIAIRLSATPGAQ